MGDVDGVVDIGGRWVAADYRNARQALGWPGCPQVNSKKRGLTAKRMSEDRVCRLVCCNTCIGRVILTTLLLSFI